MAYTVRLPDPPHLVERDSLSTEILKYLGTGFPEFLWCFGVREEKLPVATKYEVSKHIVWGSKHQYSSALNPWPCPTKLLIAGITCGKLTGR